MYLLPIYLTFISFFISFFFGKYMKDKHSNILNSLIITISFIISIYAFYEVAICKSNSYIDLGVWISSSLLQIKWLFLFDNLTCSMLIVILSISMCAHYYSIEYMFQDPNKIKFMCYLSLFTFFMIILVTAGNLATLFVGWEGVGIRSYLLINFWHSRMGANKSAVMAMLVNKIGDISLMIAFGIIYIIFHNLDFNIINLYFQSNVHNKDVNSYIYLISIFIIIGCVGKSAQLGLHTWLPEAMEGPTPVSSSIHAATMVTAGIFLIIRLNYIFLYVPSTLIIIISLGSLTAFMGSTIGLFQSDIKKIIAYSTCSQLGYMFLACGLGGFQYSFYHLINHAFFKALLFLTAGYIIHAFDTEQDIRKLGGLLFILPFAYVCILIGSLSLSGFPFFSGFHSKEKIIELFYTTKYIYLYNINIIIFCSFISTIAVTFTLAYSVKLLVYVFLHKYQNSKFYLKNIHYSSYYTILPLFFLIIMSVISGYILEDMMVGINNSFWYLDSYTDDFNINYYEYNLFSSKLPIISIFYYIGTFTYLFYAKEATIFYLKMNSKYNNFIYIFLNKKYIFLNKNIYYKIIDISYKFALNYTFKLFDKGIIEIIGPYGISTNINKIVTSQSKLDTGLVYHYLGIAILGIILIFLFSNNLDLDMNVLLVNKIK